MVRGVPLLEQTAEQVARLIVDQFISRIGSPIVVHSDQGRNFDSDLFRAVCNLLEVARTRTTQPPTSNGQVVRYNRVILGLIRCHISGENDRWNEAIPLLTRAIRSMKNRHTSMTANMLMLGRRRAAVQLVNNRVGRGRDRGKHRPPPPPSHSFPCPSPSRPSAPGHITPQSSKREDSHGDSPAPTRRPAGCSLMDGPMFQDSEVEESFPIPCGGVWFRKGDRMPSTLPRPLSPSACRLTPSHPHLFPPLHPTPAQMRL